MNFDGSANRVGVFGFRMWDGEFQGSNDGTTWSTRIYKIGNSTRDGTGASYPQQGVLYTVTSADFDGGKDLSFRYIRYIIPKSTTTLHNYDPRNTNQNNYYCDISLIRLYGEESVNTIAINGNDITGVALAASTVIVAAYNGDNLIDVKLSNVSMGSFNKTVSGSGVITAGADKVKVFLWDGDGKNAIPLCACDEAAL